LEFYRAAKKKYKWTGLIPTYLVASKSADGDKGSRRNPDAPPVNVCDLIAAVLKDIADDDLALLKEEARQEAGVRRA
jgi:hypothetical protein